MHNTGKHGLAISRLLSLAVPRKCSSETPSTDYRQLQGSLVNSHTTMHSRRLNTTSLRRSL